LTPKESFRNLYQRVKTFSNWYTMELMYSGLREIGGNVKTWNRLKILVRSRNDLSVLDEVYAKKVYDQKPLRVPHNSVVIDVGAHIGAFSLYAAKVCKAKKVYSFEPCPENYATLEMNVQNNHLNSVITPIPKAIGAQAGKRDLLLCAENDGCHSFYPISQHPNAVQVECVTLKQALKENNIDHVDYLKLDCEGAEWEILETIDEETISKIRVIVMEFHLKPREEFVKLLGKHRFNVFDSEEEWRNSSYVLAAKNT
jgi:FkbM family methyltransferase